MFDDSSCSNRILTVYEYLGGIGGQYIVNIDNSRTYILKLQKVELRVYGNFVALLVFHVENDNYPTGVGEINEFGRHIFPPYFTKNKIVCPSSIEVRLKNSYKFKQEFSQYEKEDNAPFALPEFISEFLPNEYHQCAWLCDDSMYYVSLAYQQRSKHSRYSKHLKRGNYGYLYKIEHSALEITKVSASNNMNFLETLYLNIAELVLAQQACYLRFLRKLSVISSLKQDNWFWIRKINEQLQILSRDYVIFVNKICYDDISPKRVSNKLYYGLQKQNKIQENKVALQGNIKQLYDIVTSKRLYDLQVVVIFLTVLTVIISIIQFFK